MIDDPKENEQILNGISLEIINNNKDAKYCLFRYDPEHFNYEILNDIYQSIKEKIDKTLIPIPKDTCLEFVDEITLRYIRYRINKILKKKELRKDD